jgi:hypothetical protein
MWKNKKADDRMLGWLILTATMVFAAMVYLLMTLHAPTHESCVLDCAAKYRLNIDGSWLGCETLCDKRFNHYR